MGTFVRIQAVIATSLISALALFGFPALAQEEAQEEAQGESKSISIESTIPKEVDPAAAVTIEDLTIPVDQLELLVKPLTLEELQTEAAAWLLLLKDKVREISQAEIAIKRQNLAIESKEEAAKSVEEAAAQLAESEAALARASQGTPQYNRAAKQVEEAKQELKDASLAVEEAIDISEDLQEDEALQETFAEAQSEEDISTARQVLEEARQKRDKLKAGSAAYKTATEKIDALNQALISLESAERDLEAAVPDSPKYRELSQRVNGSRTTVIQASEAVLASGLAPSQGKAKAESIESEETVAALEEIGADIKTAEEPVENVNRDRGEQQTEVTEQLEDVTQVESDLKNQLVVNVTELQGDRTAIIDRFNVILDALEQKGADTTSYRKYVDAVSSIELDVTDTEGLGVRLLSWLKSEEGGLRWGINVALFLGILLTSVLVSRWVAVLTERGLKMSRTSSLFREFAVTIVERGVVAIGFCLALTSLGISLGPILALVGGASFVLAFALQSNLGNMASGLMLMIDKPFDVGDEVKVAGYLMYVDSISLANTRFKDRNGNLIILPNNTVWENEIINYTHQEYRRIVFPIDVKFDGDLEIIKEKWLEITNSHPKVLDKPSPSISTFNYHYHYYISISLKAWCLNQDYWFLTYDLLKELQKGLEELHIELPKPEVELGISQEAGE